MSGQSIEKRANWLENWLFSNNTPVSARDKRIAEYGNIEARNELNALKVQQIPKLREALKNSQNKAPQNLPGAKDAPADSKRLTALLIGGAVAASAVGGGVAINNYLQARKAKKRREEDIQSLAKEAAELLYKRGGPPDPIDFAGIMQNNPKGVAALSELGAQDPLDAIAATGVMPEVTDTPASSSIPQYVPEGSVSLWDKIKGSRERNRRLDQIEREAQYVPAGDASLADRARGKLQLLTNWLQTKAPEGMKPYITPRNVAIALAALGGTAAVGTGFAVRSRMKKRKAGRGGR